jgi:hypothetical protein
MRLLARHRRAGVLEQEFDCVARHATGLLQHRPQPQVLFHGDQRPIGRPALAHFHVDLAAADHEILGRVGEYRRLSKRALKILMLRAPDDRRKVCVLRPDDVLIFVERRLGRADDRRNQRHMIWTGDAPEIHRIAVQPRARRAVAHILRAGEQALQRNRMMRRDEGILDLDAVRAAGTHAERLIAAPVVEDAQLFARHGDAKNLRRSLGDRQPGAADQVRGVRYAGAIVP